jgi:hypothetical protein
MKFEAEEILMVIIAFIIGWFLSTMISSNKNTNVKSTSGKHRRGDEGTCCGSTYTCQGNTTCDENQDTSVCGGEMLNGRKKFTGRCVSSR